MRVVVLQARARDQRAGIAQGRDHGLVGVAELALVVNHALAFEAGRVLGEEAGLIDRERDFGGDAARFERAAMLLEDFEVLGAVAGRGVDETRAGVGRDVRAGEQRHVEIVATPAQGVGERQGFERRCRQTRQAPPAGHARRGEHVLRQAVGKDQPVADLGPVVVGRLRDLVEAVIDVLREGDGAVAGNRPRRRRPDDD